MTKGKTIQITIDNRKIEVQPGTTILRSARDNNIFIPSLCAFEHLPSYGACRLCVVEVDGLRGFPTSCTTPVEDGMVIRTDTAEVKSLRKEVLKLLLSEHPASCLFCTEEDQCRDFQGTIRKVGVTTGCRYCPNDNRCDLQQVTESVGLTETSYPVYYRGFPVEKNDPFYDRDYNLCILCGRCIRVCNNVRLNGTLSFKQRGRQTTIGPAFDRTHLEAGCEFCGACVSACPTGTLSVKTSKWSGKPEAEVATSCNYCSVGCRLMLQVKDNQVVDALPDYDSSHDRGLICAKGRFGLPEYVHSPLRQGIPKELTPEGYYNEITWEQATAVAAEKLSAISPEDSMVVVSPQLSNEDLFAAQQFVRKVLGSENIISSPMLELGADLLPFLDLALGSETIDVFEKAQGVLTVGFDSTYGYSPIGVGVKRSAQAGAYLATVSATDTNLDLLSEAAFQVDAARWPDLLEVLASAPAKGSPEKLFPDYPKEWARDVRAAAGLYSGSSLNVAVVGEGVLNAPERKDVLLSLLKLRDKHGWKIVVAHPYTNLSGMIAMGAFPGINPGEMIVNGESATAPANKAGASMIDMNKRKKVVYLIGETTVDLLPEADFLIYQNALPLDNGRKPDLILPAALFTESDGSFINGEGRTLSVKKAIEPFMQSKPDWWILQSVADRMKKGMLKLRDVSSIQNEIKKAVKGFPNLKKRIAFGRLGAKWPMSLSAKAADGPSVHVKPRYRGIPLADVVGGMKVIEERAAGVVK